MDYQTTIAANLRRLRLPGMADNLSLRLQEAHDRQLGYQEFLHLMVGDEIANRESNNFEKRIRLARFSEDCNFATYDFHFNADQLPPATVRDLATCDFIRQKQNLVLAGPPGIGKSFVAQAIGHEACRRGFEVLFATRFALRLSGEVFQMNLQFDGNGALANNRDGNTQTVDVTRAVDTYFGGAATLGVMY